jgi:conjugal transfer pilus assembly protein TraA
MNYRTAASKSALPLIAMAMLSTAAVAGTGGVEFDAMYDMIRGWTEGTLGKLLAVAAFLIGMGMGIVKQSIIAIVLGIGFALALAYAPGIIDAVFTFAV